MVREKQNMKELKDLTLLDRFLFAEAVEDQETMEIILEIILGREVMLKQLPQAEKEQRAFRWGKYIKLDVWAKDVDDTVYDTEVQKKDTCDLPRRSRAYNSIIDSKLLKAGSKTYNDLNDVFVIIIAPFDLFGKGLYKYTFEMVCKEAPELKLDDGSTRIFLNTRGTDSTGVSDELIELLKYFEKTASKDEKVASSEKIRKLQDKIDQIRSNEETGERYMKFWEEVELEKQEAYEEGERNKACESALKMKEKGFEYETIAEITGLTVEEIEKL